MEVEIVDAGEDGDLEHDEEEDEVDDEDEDMEEDEGGAFIDQAHAALQQEMQQMDADDELDFNINGRSNDLLFQHLELAGPRIHEDLTDILAAPDQVLHTIKAIYLSHVSCKALQMRLPLLNL